MSEVVTNQAPQRVFPKLLELRSSFLLIINTHHSTIEHSCVVGHHEVRMFLNSRLDKLAVSHCAVE